VQLRFCRLDSSSDQDDNFPSSICVKVNGKTVQLPNLIPSNRPGVDPKRPSRPLNVTNYVKISPLCTNTVHVTWMPDSSNTSHVLALYLVKKVTSAELLTRIKNKGAKPADYTRGMSKCIFSKTTRPD